MDSGDVDVLAQARKLCAELDDYADRHERELSQALRDAKRAEELRKPGGAKIRPSHRVNPGASAVSVAPGRDFWAVLCFVTWMISLPFRGVYRATKAIARRIEGGLPRDCFGYRSRLICPRYNRDGQPEALRGEDQLAGALWVILLCPLAYFLTWSLVARVRTPASDESFFSYHWSLFWTWASGFVSSAFWEALAAMTGIAIRPVLMVVIPAGFLQGFLYDLYPKVGYLNWLTSASNVGLGVYSVWQKEAHDTALHVILLIHSLSVALGARSRQVVPFLFCCVRVESARSSRRVNPHANAETFVIDPYTDEVVNGLSSSQIDRYRRGAQAALHKRSTLPQFVKSAVHAWTAPDPMAAESYQLCVPKANKAGDDIGSVGPE